jgi:hypothetical protein
MEKQPMTAQALTTETLRRVIGACYFSQQDALVDLFGDQIGGALATLANQSLMTFAQNSDDAATRELVTFIADVADGRLSDDTNHEIEFA